MPTKKKSDFKKYCAKKNEEEVVPTKKKSYLKKYGAKKKNLPTYI